MDKIICPKCKAENDARNLFCESCGTQLAKPPAAEKTVAASRAKPVAAVPPPAPVQPMAAPPAAPVMQAPPPAPVARPTPPPAQGYPQQPYGYYPGQMYGGTPIKQLGVRSDGWSDVIEDAAGIADKVKGAFVEEMGAQKIQGLRVTNVSLSNGAMETRAYQLVNDARGTTIVVSVTPYGKNLFVGWDLYVHRSINWLTVGLLGGIALVIAVLDTWAINYYYSGFFASVFGFLGTFLNLLLVPSLAILLFGKIVKDDWTAAFVKSLDEFGTDDAVALSTVVENALTRAIEKGKETPPAKPKAKK